MARKRSADLPTAIRAAKVAQGITYEALRAKAQLGGGTFYGLLKGDARVLAGTRVETLRKLKAAGVEVPPTILAA